MMPAPPSTTGFVGGDSRVGDNNSSRPTLYEHNTTTTTPSSIEDSTHLQARSIEKKFKRRYASLQRSYEDRLVSLLQKVPILARQAVENDEALSTMMLDDNSLQFIPERLDEITAQSLIDEKELFIQRLANENSKQEATIVSMKHENQTLADRVSLQSKSICENQRVLSSNQSQLIQLKDQSASLMTQNAELQRLVSTMQGQLCEKESLANELSKNQAVSHQEWEKQRFVSIKDFEVTKLQLEQAREKINDLSESLSKMTDQRDHERGRAQNLKKRLRQMEKVAPHNNEVDSSVQNVMQRQMDWSEREVERMRLEVARYEELNREVNQKYHAMGKEVEELLEEESLESRLTIDRLKAKNKQLATDRITERQEAQAQYEELKLESAKLREDYQNARKNVVTLESEVADLQVKCTELNMQSTRKISSLEGEIAALVKESNDTLEIQQMSHEETQHELRQTAEVYKTKIQQMEESLVIQEERVRADALKAQQATMDINNQQKYQEKIETLQHQFAEMQKKQKSDFEKAKQQSNAQLEQVRNEALLQAQSQGGVENSEMFQQLLHSRCEEHALVLKSTHISVAEHQKEVQSALREYEVKLQDDFEKKLRQQLHEFDDKKAQEYKVAMINVRQGIKKIEAQLSEEKNGRIAAEEKYERQLELLKSTQEQLEDEIASKSTLLAQLEEANVNIHRLSQVIEDGSKYVEGYQDAKQEQETLADKYKNVQEELVSVKEALKVAHTQLSENAATHTKILNKERERLEEENEASSLRSTRKLEELQEILDTLKSKFDSQREEHVEALLAAQDSATVQLEASNVQVSELQSELSSLKQELESALSTIKTHEDSIRSLNAQVEKTNADLDAEVDRHEQSRVELQESLQLEKTRVKQIKRLRRSVQKLSDAVVSLKRDTLNDLDGVSVNMNRSWHSLEMQLLTFLSRHQLDKEQALNSTLNKFEGKAAEKIQALERLVNEKTHEMQMKESEFALKLQRESGKLQALQEEIKTVESAKADVDSKLLELQSRELASRQENTERIKKIREQCCEAVAFYSKLLLSIGSDMGLLPLRESDKSIIHEMQSHWNDLTYHPGDVEQNDRLKLHFSKLYHDCVERSVADFQAKLETPIKKELHELQVSSGLIQQESVTSNNSSVSAKLYESIESNKQMEIKLKDRNLEIHALQEQIKKLRDEIDVKRIETDGEITRLQKRLSDTTSHQESDLESAKLDYEARLEQISIKSKMQKEREIKDLTSAMAELEERLKAERIKVNDLRQELLNQAEKAELELEKAYDASRKLQAEIRIKNEDVFVIEESLRKAQGTNEKLLRDLEKQSILPPTSSNGLAEQPLSFKAPMIPAAMRYSVEDIDDISSSTSSSPKEEENDDGKLLRRTSSKKMAELSTLMEQSLYELTADGARTAAQLDASAQALQAHAKRQSELFQKKVNRNKISAVVHNTTSSSIDSSKRRTTTISASEPRKGKRLSLDQL